MPKSESKDTFPIFIVRKMSSSLNRTIATTYKILECVEENMQDTTAQKSYFDDTAIINCINYDTIYGRKKNEK